MVYVAGAGVEGGVGAGSGAGAGAGVGEPPDDPPWQPDSPRATAINTPMACVRELIIILSYPLRSYSIAMTFSGLFAACAKIRLPHLNTSPENLGAI
jgi:hypothetical protein